MSIVINLKCMYSVGIGYTLGAPDKKAEYIEIGVWFTALGKFSDFIMSVFICRVMHRTFVFYASLRYVYPATVEALLMISNSL